MWVLPCVIGKVRKGKPPILQKVRGDAGFGSTNDMHAIGVKVWVKQPNGPPKPADRTVQGKGNTVSDDPWMGKMEICAINALSFS